MLILVIGAKGGVGATALAKELALGGNGVGLDLADGQLAAQLERTAWTLTRVVFSSSRQRRQALDDVVQRRITLLWMPECSLVIEDAVQGIEAALQSGVGPAGQYRVGSKDHARDNREQVPSPEDAFHRE